MNKRIFTDGTDKMEVYLSTDKELTILLDLEFYDLTVNMHDQSKFIVLNKQDVGELIKLLTELEKEMKE